MKPSNVAWGLETAKSLQLTSLQPDNTGRAAIILSPFPMQNRVDAAMNGFQPASPRYKRKPQKIYFL
jgi:hypothetical protein